jgi:hypothetical protein
VGAITTDLAIRSSLLIPNPLLDERLQVFQSDAEAGFNGVGSAFIQIEDRNFFSADKPLNVHSAGAANFCRIREAH